MKKKREGGGGKNGAGAVSKAGGAGGSGGGGGGGGIPGIPGIPGLVLPRLWWDPAPKAPSPPPPSPSPPPSPKPIDTDRTGPTRGDGLYPDGAALTYDTWTRYVTALHDKYRPVDEEWERAKSMVRLRGRGCVTLSRAPRGVATGTWRSSWHPSLVGRPDGPLHLARGICYHRYMSRLY